MKKEKGITLVALVIYMSIITGILAALSVLTTRVYQNAKKLGTDNISAEEFNKFNVAFVKDVKNNRSVTVTPTKNTDQSVSIKFEDGTTYNYIAEECSIYRNKVKIAKNINYFIATAPKKITYTSKKDPDITIDKNIIEIRIGTGKYNSERKFGKTINYVLKYW